MQLKDELRGVGYESDVEDILDKFTIFEDHAHLLRVLIHVTIHIKPQSSIQVDGEYLFEVIQQRCLEDL